MLVWVCGCGCGALASVRVWAPRRVLTAAWFRAAVASTCTNGPPAGADRFELLCCDAGIVWDQCSSHTMPVSLVSCSSDMTRVVRAVTCSAVQPSGSQGAIPSFGGEHGAHCRTGCNDSEGCRCCGCVVSHCDCRSTRGPRRRLPTSWWRCGDCFAPCTSRGCPCW